MKYTAEQKEKYRNKILRKNKETLPKVTIKDGFYIVASKMNKE